MGHALTFRALAHNVMRICYCQRPVETLTKSLLHKCSPTDVMRTHAVVYFVEQLLSFGC
jgi:hypothetical protein